MIILGVDLGKAGTGLAVCDKGELLASPLCVLREHNRERLVEAIAAKAQEWFGDGNAAHDARFDTAATYLCVLEATRRGKLRGVL